MMSGLPTAPHEQARPCATTINNLLRLTGVWVTGGEFVDDEPVVLVDVRLRRPAAGVPHCGWTTAARHY